MQKIISYFLLLLSLYVVVIPLSGALYQSLSGYAPYQTPESYVPPASQTLQAASGETKDTLDENKILARSACVMDASTGRVLFGKDADKQMPQASTTKIMTCIVILEQADLSDTVTFSKHAASMPDVQLGAASGESFVLKDLLYSLMLESHNDTAVALAEHVGGSVEGFAALMNAKAEEIGLTDTHFVTPNGLDADTHYTTAKDLCLLSAYAITNEDFLEIIQTPSKTIHSTSKSKTYSLSNKDRFLNSYKGAMGIKTGFTGNAGYCFAGAAKRGNTTLVSAVLACGWPPNKNYKWKDTKALMNFGFSNFSSKEFLIETPEFQAVPVENGTDAAITPIFANPIEPFSLLVSKNDSITVEYNMVNTLTAPVRQGDILGQAMICLNGEPLEEMPIVASSSTEKRTFPYFLRILQNLFLF